MTDCKNANVKASQDQT